MELNLHLGSCEYNEIAPFLVVTDVVPAITSPMLKSVSKSFLENTKNIRFTYEYFWMCVSMYLVCSCLKCIYTALWSLAVEGLDCAFYDPPHPHGKRRDPHIIEKILKI